MGHAAPKNTGVGEDKESANKVRCENRKVDLSRRLLECNANCKAAAESHVATEPRLPGRQKRRICTGGILKVGICQGFSSESSPNVEHSKMWSEPDECALGTDFGVIDST